MLLIEPIYVGKNATHKLIDYCEMEQLGHFTLIADRHTYQALGESVENALKKQGREVASIILKGEEIIADEHYLVQTLIHAPIGASTFLAVGSGTITDITRFISHRTGRAFISLPTAPSVDGFTSIGAPLVINGVKQTFSAQAPIALFADLDTLCNAPQKLIAAGYGDMIGKFTSLADWRLGALLWDEPFDETIYKRTQAAVQRCIQHTEAISQRSEEGVRHLMEALIESGLCMLDIGNSRPASGTEHHASHYWEMKLLQEKRPAALHGAKVGFALIHAAAYYAKIRAMSRQTMLDCLEAATLPSQGQEEVIIQKGYGALAEEVIREHQPFIAMTSETFDSIKRRIAENWDDIQAIAATVPAPDEIQSYLQQAGGVTEAVSLGLRDDEISVGFTYGHYLRNRFTVLKLNRFLNQES